MNKQQKQLKKLGLASCNGGDSTTINKINHGAYAFQDPAVAIDRKKRNNVRTWKDHEIKEGEEYAILTNIIHKEWSGVSVKEHKNIKGLQSQNLRDHMSEAELIFTALAELSTRQIAEVEKANRARRK